MTTHNDNDRDPNHADHDTADPHVDADVDRLLPPYHGEPNSREVVSFYRGPDGCLRMASRDGVMSGDGETQQVQSVAVYRVCAMLQVESAVIRAVADLSSPHPVLLMVEGSEDAAPHEA